MTDTNDSAIYTPRYIGYARVSTPEQSLDLQYDALRQAGCSQIFQDHGLSGANDDRAGLNNALAILKSGDVLVIWKLDRLGRSLRFLVELSEDLAKRNIGLYSISDGIRTDSSTGRLVMHVIGAIAQFERELISERTKAGMAAAKKRGTRIGRPRKSEI